MVSPTQNVLWPEFPTAVNTNIERITERLACRPNALIIVGTQKITI